MVAHVSTVAFNGIETLPVDVQVHIAGGEPSFTVVGLPSGSVRESRERIRSALHALGLRLPAKRITINLSPADIAKEGSHYDLPIAIGLLVEMTVLPADSTQNALFVGEIGLDGSLAPVSGALPAAIHAVSHQQSHIFLPSQNSAEAAWAKGVDVLAPTHLTDILAHFSGENPLGAVQPKTLDTAEVFAQNLPDMKDVRGQENAKRAVEIAAAGGHNLLMSGPPGSGKSMLAARMNGLLPPLSPQEALEVSMVHSVAGMLNENGLVTARPYRDPHHSASAVALTGGGLKAKPGEMSLAHRGVLFLDELPEFPRQVLETLRQPIETGKITISRANKHVTYPARFQLVAAMNPCPCGYFGAEEALDNKKLCSRAPKCAEQYVSRISGPLLDRFDVQIAVPPVKATDMALPPAKEGTQEIAKRIAKARTLQTKRLAKVGLVCNADMSGKILEDTCPLDEPSRAMMTQAAGKFGLSARGYHRVLKVARTIADLAQSPRITKAHLAEALSYRGM